MLAFDPSLSKQGLKVKKEKTKWIISGHDEKIKAIINLKEPEKDHWSDLLSPPEENLDAVFYPDGEHEIKTSAYDQFFPARHDAMALAVIEHENTPYLATLSFHAAQDKTTKEE